MTLTAPDKTDKEAQAPGLERPFRCPGLLAVPVLASLAVLTSYYPMLNLPAATWIRFAVWMVAGFAIYFLSGAGHSRLTTDSNYAREADAVAREARAEAAATIA